MYKSNKPRCSALTKTNSRCLKPSQRGTVFCWMHTPEEPILELISNLPKHIELYLLVNLILILRNYLDGTLLTKIE